MPTSPGTSRALLTAASLLAAGLVGLPVGAATAAPDRTAVSSLRDAVAAGDTALAELPRGTVVRRPRTTAALRSSTAAQAPELSTALTAAPVSRIDVVFVDTPGHAWSTQAKAAFRAAADVWQRTVESRVPILVRATARDLGPGVLGGAGPYDFLRNEGTTVVAPGRAPTAAQVRDDVFEPVALYNARTGRDARPPQRGELNPDIEAEFDLRSGGLHLGTDGRPGAGQVDFRTVVMHEIGHGLGLAGTASLDGDRASVGLTGVNGSTGVRSGVSFDRFTYATTAAQAGSGGTPVLALPDGSAALRAALTGDALYWSGQHARTAAGGSVRLHAPSRCGGQGPARTCLPGESPFVEGSSYSHLDDRRYPRASADALMTPYLEPGEAYAGPGQVALGLLADLGYAVPALTGQRFTAVDPTRLLDTRTGHGTALPGALPAGRVLDLQVTGRGGVPTTATAVVLNLTGVSPTALTGVRAYPTPVTSQPAPEVTHLTLTRGVHRAALVTVPVGDRGRVRLWHSGGSTHLLADLSGWYGPTAGSTFRAVDPARVLDTRRSGRAVPAGGVVDLRVAGVGRVPAGATAVAFTLTALGATATTDVKAYPAPAGPSAGPLVNHINVASPASVPNLVVVRVGANGVVRLRNNRGSVHLVADLAGYYSADPGGDRFRAVTPRRVLDTRTRLGTPAGTPTRLGVGQTTTLSAGGATTIPRSARAVVLTVTGVAASARTDLRAYPATATTVPFTSPVTVDRGQNAAGHVVVRLGGSALRLRNSFGTVGVVADAAGWFGPA